MNGCHSSNDCNLGLICGLCVLGLLAIVAGKMMGW